MHAINYPGKTVPPGCVHGHLRELVLCDQGLGSKEKSVPDKERKAVHGLGLDDTATRELDQVYLLERVTSLLKMSGNV